MDVPGKPQPGNLWIALGKTPPWAAIAFVREIAARIEQYWRPIKRDVDPADPQPRYAQSGSLGDGPLARKDAAPGQPAPTRTVTRAVRPTR